MVCFWVYPISHFYYKLSNSSASPVTGINSGALSNSVLKAAYSKYLRTFFKKPKNIDNICFPIIAEFRSLKK